MAESAIKLAVNLIKAAERARVMHTWVNNQKDMAKALSCFESSAANFVKNQSEQFSHYAIQAALEFAKLIGEIVATFGKDPYGIGTIAGQTLSKSAALAQTAEEIAYEFYKKADLELAWRATRKAWDNPESRKLALKARSLNPTLAKYSLAWGATVKHDKLCQSAMASCGLNALTLSHKDSNVAKVQQYLETCFSEDNVVLKAYRGPQWNPGPLELTLKSWSTLKSRGESQSNLQPENTSTIEECLAVKHGLQQEFVELVAVMRQDDSMRLAEFGDLAEEYEAALLELKSAFASFGPRTVKGEVHLEMESALKQLQTLAEEAMGEVDDARLELLDLGLDALFDESEEEEEAEVLSN